MTEYPLFQYPYAVKRLSIEGHNLSYLDEGRGTAVVMVHGNPSWSYLFRNAVEHLRGEYRCIVPDHMGCGFSDKPQNYPYRLQTHINNLERLLDHLHIDRCVLIVHDWGGAIGMGWAGRHVDRVKGVVVLNTAAFRSQRIPLRIAICRWPLLGALIVRGLNGFAWPAVYMAVTERMTPEIARGFLAPYDSWSNRVAVHSFVRDIPLTPGSPSWETLVEVESSLQDLKDKPMLICWGGKDFCFNDHFYREWRDRFPSADSHYFPDAGHYVLEDAGRAIFPLISNFLANKALPDG